MPRSAIQAAARPQRPALGITARVTIAAADAGQPTAPRRFRISAYTGEPLLLWNWEYPVVIDLATADISAQSIPALYDHIPDESYIVGQVERLAIEGPNLTPPLIAEGRFTPTGTERDYATRVIARADAGYQWQASVGGDPSQVDRVEAGQSITVNGRSYPGPVCVARGVVFREVSFVVLGADRRTSAVVAHRRIKGSAMPTFEEWLASLGFPDQSVLDATQMANMQLLYQAEYPPTETPPTTETPAATASDTQTTTTPPATETNPTATARGGRTAVRATATAPTPADAIAARRVAEAAEEDRIAFIRATATDNGVSELELGSGANRTRVNFVSHAIRQGWDRTRVELEAVRASRGSGPSVIVRAHDRDCSLQAMQGAMILRAGGRLDHRAYQSQGAYAAGIPAWLRAGINDAQRNQMMEAAHNYSDMSLVDVCRESLRINGQDAPHGRRDMIRAAFSGGALANIFTSNVNAILLASYVEAGDTTGGWVREAEVADFKTQERPRVEIMGALNKLARGGTADHAKRSDNLESYRIARYAGQFVIDEQDIIDDSMNAFGDTPQQMGAAAARLRPDLVYSILLANPTLNATGRALFNVTDANLGSSSALNAANLRAAVSAMWLIRENAVSLNLRPSHLIVPPSLRHVALELINSQTLLIAGTAGSVTERGSMNALTADQLTPVADARLENGVIDPNSGATYAGSGTTWFLAATMAHTIEVGYLRGTGRSPQVRSFILDKGKYGMGWDVAMDIGAKAMDWRGLRKTTA